MYEQRGGKRHSRDVKLVRMGMNGRRRRRGTDRMIIVLLCFIVLLLAVCIGALYFVFRSKKDEAVPASKGHQESDIELLSSDAPTETAIPETPAPEAHIPLVVIDPGHGGWDNGCSRSGVKEQEVNLAISLCLNEKLKELGYDTVLIREDNDTGMDKEDRVKLSKEVGADIYVSVHQNSYGEEGQDNYVTGVETYYTVTNEDSIVLAQLVQAYVSKNTGARDRGIINMESLHVIRENTCPSCLVETGFLTNATERKSLTTAEYQEKIASGIAQAVEEFVEFLQEKENTAQNTKQK